MRMVSIVYMEESSTLDPSSFEYVRLKMASELAYNAMLHWNKDITRWEPQTISTKDIKEDSYNRIYNCMINNF